MDDIDRAAFHVASTFARPIARGGDEARAAWSAAMGLEAPRTSLVWRGAPPRPGGRVATLPAAKRAAISADGRRAYLASDSKVAAHALPAGDQLWVVEEPEPRGLAVHPGGDLFVVSKESVRRYDPAGKLRRSSSWKRRLTGPAAIHPAGRHLVGLTDDEEVAVVDLETDRIVALLRVIEDEYPDVRSLACLEDRVRIATRSEIIDLPFSFASKAPPEARWPALEALGEDAAEYDDVEETLPLADGRLLVSSGHKILSLCNGAQGDEICKLAAEGYSLFGASPDSRLSAVGDYRETRVIDIADRPAAASHLGEVEGLWALDDGRVVSTGLASCDLLVTLDGERLLRVPEACGLLLYCDAEAAIVLSDERLFRVDIESGDQRSLERGHSLGPAPAWSDGRRCLVSYPTEKLLGLVDRGRDKSLLLAGHRGVIRALSVDPAGERVASGDDGGEVLLWDLVHDGERAADPRYPDARAPIDRWSVGAPVVAARWYGGGVAVGTADGRIVVKASNGIERILSSEGPRIVAIRAAGSGLVAADASGRLRVWSRDGRAPAATFQAHDTSPSALEADDDLIVTGGADGGLRVHRFSGEVVGRWEARAGITALALRRGSIVYGDAAGEIGSLALRST